MNLSQEMDKPRQFADLYDEMKKKAGFEDRLGDFDRAYEEIEELVLPAKNVWHLDYNHQAAVLQDQLWKRMCQ